MSKEQLRSAAASEVDRWEGVLGDELTRLFDRQQAVVLVRLQGTKARKHTRHWEPAGERKLDASSVVDVARWVKEASTVVLPILGKMYAAVWERLTGALGGVDTPDDDSLTAALDARLAAVVQGVETAVGEVQTFIDGEEAAGTPMADIAAGVRDLYAQRTSTWVARITTLSAVGTINHAAMSAAFNAGSVSKQWLSRHDERVRDTHVHADGQVRPILARFRLGGIPTHPATSELLFPGDPDGALDETINCRCTLLFSPPDRRVTGGGGGMGGVAAAKAAGLVVGAGVVAAGAAVGASAGVAGAGASAGAVAAGTAAYVASQSDEAKGLPAPDLCDCPRFPDDPHRHVRDVRGGCPPRKRNVGAGTGGTAAVAVARINDGLLAGTGGDGGMKRDVSSAGSLEVKDRVRTPAGVRTYGQPIGSIIHRDPTLPTFSAGPRGSAAAHPVGSSGSGSTSSRPGSGTPHTIAGLKVETGHGDVYKLAAKYDANGVAPDRASTSALALRDHKGRIGAYVIWQTHDGAQPAGTIVAVSVHPKLQGQHIGDELVAAAATIDPNIKVTTRPRTSTPATPSSRSVTNAPSRAVAVQGPPVIRDRSLPTDSPGTSGDFNADAARIERLQTAYLRDGVDTGALFSKRGRWTPAREKQQQAVIDHFLAKPTVKADRQCLILGGVPGAGKTTTINSPAGQAALGINLDDYVTVNADEVKAVMAEMGMVPDYPGLSPLEVAPLIQAESNDIACALMRQAAKQHKNFAYDATLRSSGQALTATSTASRVSPPPWTTTMLFVDVPLSVAKQRARDRYLAGDRYVPLAFIDKMRPMSKRATSGPAENFDLVKKNADRWVVVDNAGAAPVVVSQGGRGGRARGPRPPVPVAVPSPAPTRPRPPAPAQVPVAVPAAASAAPRAATPGVPAGLPPVPAGTTVYAHPQGKHIYVHPDGSMETFRPDGKRATTSATPAKLAAGYGGWTQVVGPDADPAGAAAAAQVVTSATHPVTSAGPALVPSPAAPVVEQPSIPAPAHARPVVPMDFNEAPLADVPKYIADPNYVFQQKVDGIRGVLVVEPGKKPWFASKKGDQLVSSTAAKITGPLLAKLPATPAGSPGYRVEGELLNGKWHVFDMITDGGENVPYETRKTMADAWVDAVSPALPAITALPTARTAAEKQALWDKVLASGAEGVMMKRRDSPYNGGARVSHTLKAKVTATADAVVLSRNVGGKDNAEFGLRQGGKTISIGNVSTGGKDKALGQINPGDVVEIEYLWASDGHKLAQPRILRKRPDKTEADATDVSQLRHVDKTVLALAKKRMLAALERAGLVLEGVGA